MTLRSVVFTVPGEPVSKDRPRCVSRKNGQQFAVTTDRTKDAEEAVARCYQEKAAAQGLGGEFLDAGGTSLYVTIDFYEGHRTPQRRQDIDNLAKLVLDALNKVAWEDDAAVTTLELRVWRNQPNPHTSVYVAQMPYPLQEGDRE